MPGGRYLPPGSLLFMRNSKMKRTFSILGDSYSTFKGYIPEGYSVYYPWVESVPDVLRVEDTWWHLLMQRRNLELLKNNSYSGSTVCTNVRPGQPGSSSFVERAKLCFSAASRGEPQPDYIFVFGTTNDSWLERDPGQLQFERWAEADLEKVLPAYCFVLDHMKKENPESRLVCVINTQLKPQIAAGLEQAAAHYGAAVIRLQDIDKSNGHPSKLGMRQICEQIESVLF